MYNASMTRLELSFLDTFHVTLDQRPVTHFRSANNKGLLVYLALHGERPVAREVLAALLWPDESDTVAHNNLRQAIYQLRQLLGDVTNGDASHLLVTRQTVQFNPHGDHALDVDLFLRAIETRDLDAAAALYAGELLPGFTCDSLEFEEWLRLEREKLHQLALEVLFEAARDHLAAGRLDKARVLARRQLALEPWREPAYRQLMQAYALAGDRAAVLAQYERCREVLWSELGVEPASETAALLEEIKAGRYSRPATDEIIRPPPRTRHNLPAETTPFIGRELELSQIDRLFTHDRQRLVTIVGPGGMGKTRLALAVGAALLERYEDGVYFVDLAPLDRAEGILQAIAVALDYQAPDRSAELKPQLLTALAQRCLLLILDNFEQVLDGSAYVNEILQTCPQVSILATSRERLHLTGESRYELGGLDFPDEMPAGDALDYTAVRLFAESGRRARPGFEITPDNVADVVRICRQVGGMPLALVLTAAWLELLTPAEIAAEIERGVEFLAADLGDLPARQRSMQTVFACSWQLMPAEEQSVMAGLSVFRESFTREAAEAVAGANLRVLLALVNKSLLQRRPDSGRFTIHELLRQFAAGQRRRDPNEQAEMAHCQYFARLVKTELRAVREIAPLFVPGRLAGDAENVRRAWDYAVDHGLVEETGDLAGGVYAFAGAQGIHMDTLFEGARQSLARRGVAETHPAMLRLRLIQLINLWGSVETFRSKGLFLEFIPTAEPHGEPEILFCLYQWIAALCREEADAKALVWTEKITTIARRMDDDYYLLNAEVDKILTHAALHPDEVDDVMDLPRLKTILSYLNANYPTSRLAFHVLSALCYGFLSIYDYEQALYYGARCLSITKGWHDLYTIGSVNYQLARIRLQMERPSEAAQHLLDALDWHLAIGKVWQAPGSLYSMQIAFAPLFGDGENVVPILSMVYHHPESIDRYRTTIAAALPQFEAAMGADTFVAAWERGRALDFDTVVAQTRAALVSVGQG